jgi:hypothetical protein
MQHWMEYVKASYEIVMMAESRANICLEHEIEAYTVHTLARHMCTPNIPSDAIAIKIMTAMNSSLQLKKAQLQTIAEECLLIDGLQLNTRRWPSKTYYRDMGRLALESRAWSEHPPELLYERVAQQFETISHVLHAVNGR